METITVMSFNMKRDLFPFGSHTWHKRAAQVADLIRQVAPDILGTQELTEGPLGDMERLLPQYRWVGEGRGGGRNGFAQGSVQASQKEIEGFFQAQKEAL